MFSSESAAKSIQERAIHWLLVLMLIIAAFPVRAGTLTPATGGEAIPSETVGGAFTELTGLIYEEANKGEVGVGTIVLQLPPGFEWDTSAPPPSILVERIGGPGGANINGVADSGRIAAFSANAQQITFTITSPSSGNRRNRLIFEGLAVRPQQTAPEASGDIWHMGSSNIAGVQVGVTSWGYLEQLPSQGNIFLTANGEWESPVVVVAGEDVVLEVTGLNCPIMWQWRDTWDIDGTQEQSLSAASPCTRSPIVKTENFALQGTYEITFQSEYCTTSGPCPAWDLYDEATITIEVTDAVQPADAELVLEYRMETRDWDGSIDEITDSSGNAAHGFSESGANSNLVNPADPDDPGTCRYADLTGAGRIQGPVPTALNDEGEFSVALWLRMGAGADSTIIGIGDFDGNYAERFELYQTSAGDLAARFRYDNNNDVELSATGSQVFDDTWHHVAVTRHFEPNGNKTRVIERLFIDGNIVDFQILDYSPGQWPGSALLQPATGGIHLASFPGSIRSGSLLLDELRLYIGGLTETEINGVMAMTNRCGYPDAFLVQVPATASVCAPAEIAISVLDRYGDIVPYYEGVAELSTSSGRGLWTIVAATGTLSGGGVDDGAANYTFVEADGAAVTLALANQSADNLIINVVDAAAGISGSSAVLGFRENAFELIASDSLGNDVVAGRPHAMQLRALRQDPGTGQCGLNTHFDGPVSLKLWLDRTAADPGGAAPMVGSAALPDAVPAINNVTASFTSGEATLTLEADDVGQYRIEVLDNTSGLVEDESDTPRPVQGVSSILTARPFGFAFDSIEMNGSANPGGVTPSGDIFGPAGESFGLRLIAVNHQPANDVNDDGIPDPDATLSAVGATPTFGWNGSLSVNKFEPAEGVAGSVSGADATFTNVDFVAGAASLPELSYSEVGAVSLRAEAGAYLGTAIDIIGDSAMIGRFTPAELSVTANVPLLATSCAPAFSYIGENLDYAVPPEITIVPLNAQGAQTLNYADFTSVGGDNWWRMTTDITPAYTDAAAPAALNINDAMASHSPGADQPTGAEVTLVFAGSLAYSWEPNAGSPPAPLVSPFDADIGLAFDVVDADGIGYDDGAGGHRFDINLSFDQAEEQRHGRLRLPNGHGSELLDLKVALRTQYYAGVNAGFIDNSNDSCTQNVQLALTPAVPATCAFETGGADESGIGCGAAKIGLNWMEPTSGGDFNLWLRAPTGQITGSVALGIDGTAANLPTWLRYDWDNDGDHDDWPTAIATFGIHGGNPKQIGRRERW